MAQDVNHHEGVLDAAIEMINEAGAIDMKLLAARSGISRATLYRHYSDKDKVEGEIAARTLEQLVAAVAVIDGDIIDRCQRAALFLIDHPAGSSAIVSMAAKVSVEVLVATSDLAVGDGNYAPWLLGIAAMSRTANRGDERQQLRDLVAGLAERC